MSHDRPWSREPASLIANISSRLAPSFNATLDNLSRSTSGPVSSLNVTLDNLFQTWQPFVPNPDFPLGSLQNPYPHHQPSSPLRPTNVPLPPPILQTSPSQQPGWTSQEPNLSWIPAYHYARMPDIHVGSSATAPWPSPAQNSGNPEVAQGNNKYWDDLLPPTPSLKEPKSTRPPPVPPKTPVDDPTPTQRNLNRPHHPHDLQKQPQTPSIPQPPPQIHGPKRCVRFAPKATVRYPKAHTPSPSSNSTTTRRPLSSSYSHLSSTLISSPLSPSQKPAKYPSRHYSRSPPPSRKSAKSPPYHPFRSSPPPLSSRNLNPYADWPLCCLCGNKPAMRWVGDLEVCERCWREAKEEAKEEDRGRGRRRLDV